MTVENTNTEISYTGNNSVTVFAYDFLTYQNSHLFVYLDDVEQTVGFTVTGIGDDSGGDVTFDVAPLTDVIVKIERIVPYTQLIEYQQYGPFDALSNERGLDLSVMLAIQNERILRDALLKNEDELQTVNGPVVFAGHPLTIEEEPTEPTHAARLQDIDAVANATAKSAKAFGAMGDSTNGLDGTDDTEALKLWASQGGRLFLPRGVYRVTGEIRFPPMCTVFGESAGGGTGGGETASLLDEAVAGASIIFADSVNWGGDEHCFLSENLNTDLKANPSCVFYDLKIMSSRTGAAPCHLLTIINGYDSMFLRNLNLLFVHPDHQALRCIEIDGTIFPTLSQTGIVENVVAIGDDFPGASVEPVVFFRRQQETQLIGLKVFGVKTASYLDCERVPIALEGCRGLTVIGCSAASTNTIGIDIYSTETSTDGVVLTGMTFELCEGGGFNIDGFSRNIDIPNVTVSNVEFIAPRYQFPQSIAGFLRGAEQCRAYVGTKQITVSDDSSNNVITGYSPENYTNTTGGIAGRSNLYVALPNAAGETYRLTEGMGVQKDSPAYDFVSADKTRGYRWLASISTAADNGMELRDFITQDVMVTFTKNGQLQFNIEGQGPVLKTPDTTKDYELSITNDGDLFIRNNIDSSDVHINNDRPVDSAQVTYTLSSVNIGGTVNKTAASPNNVTIPLDTTPITINAEVAVVQEGAGQVTIQGVAGITLNGVLDGSCTIEGWEVGLPVAVVLTKRGANNWRVMGANSVVA